MHKTLKCATMWLWWYTIYNNPILNFRAILSRPCLVGLAAFCTFSLLVRRPPTFVVWDFSFWGVLSSSSCILLHLSLARSDRLVAPFFGLKEDDILFEYLVNLFSAPCNVECSILILWRNSENTALIYGNPFQLLSFWITVSGHDTLWQ